MTIPEEGDPDAKFHEVVGLLEDWSPDPEDRGVEVSRGLRRMLDARLNAEGPSRWERDIVERQRGTLAADVTINGEIAVAVLGSARTAAVSSIRSRLSLLGGRYNYLVVYWRDAVDDDGDARRLIERRTTARSIGVEAIAFVGEEVPEDADLSGDGPFPLPGLTTGAIAVGAAIGLGLFLSANGVVRGIDAVGEFPPLARAFVLGSGLLFCSVLGLALFLAR
jgi:hypothetical protein